MLELKECKKDEKQKENRKKIFFYCAHHIEAVCCCFCFQCLCVYRNPLILFTFCNSIIIVIIIIDIC